MVDTVYLDSGSCVDSIISLEVDRDSHLDFQSRFDSGWMIYFEYVVTHRIFPNIWLGTKHFICVS